MNEVREKLILKTKKFRRVFGGGEGKAILEALEEGFDHDEIKSSDPHETYYRLGQRDVVVYIKQMIKASEKNDD